MQSASEAALGGEWCSAPRSATVSPRLLRQLALDHSRQSATALGGVREGGQSAHRSHLLWFCPQMIWIVFHVRQLIVLSVRIWLARNLTFQVSTFVLFCLLFVFHQRPCKPPGGGAMETEWGVFPPPSACVCLCEGKRINNLYIPRSPPPSSLSFTAKIK